MTLSLVSAKVLGGGVDDFLIAENQEKTTPPTGYQWTLP